MVQKKKKKVSNLPKVKKELKDFMADDEGKMTRKDVAKLGVSLAVLGMMMQPGSAQARHMVTTDSHSNSVTVNPNSSGQSCVTHHNVSTQIDYHYNHSDGGWMC